MHKKASYTRVKYKQQILELANTYLRTRPSDPKLVYCSFTKIEANEDYTVVTLYWDTFNSGMRGDFTTSFDSNMPRLRSFMAQALKVRAVPYFILAYDGQYEAQAIIENILVVEKFPVTRPTA